MALNAFVKYLHGTLDIILGHIRRKYKESDGDELITSGKEAIMDLSEKARDIFVRPILIVV